MDLPFFLRNGCSSDSPSQDSPIPRTNSFYHFSFPSFPKGILVTTVLWCWKKSLIYSFLQTLWIPFFHRKVVQQATLFHLANYKQTLE